MILSTVLMSDLYVFTSKINTEPQTATMETLCIVALTVYLIFLKEKSQLSDDHLNPNPLFLDIYVILHLIRT